MKPKTIKALKASIKHWQDNVRAYVSSDVHLGPDHCALCKVFWKSIAGDYEPETKGSQGLHQALAGSCRGCPVMERTGKICCFCTPYARAEDAHDAWTDAITAEVRADARDAWRKAAQAELDFLISLLPEGEQP